MRTGGLEASPGNGSRHHIGHTKGPHQAYWLFGAAAGVAGFVVAMMLGAYELAIPCGAGGLRCVLRLLRVGDRLDVHWSATDPLAHQLRRRLRGGRL